MGISPVETARELASIADWGDGGGWSGKVALDKGCVADSGVLLYSWLEYRLVAH